jgi:threonylcarbamoyladenosine tRNA methylthiotransferase MtaB
MLLEPPTYRITTLGCRVNHAETREIESILLARGLRRAERGGRADLEIVHSCSVTNTAAAKSRQALRRASRCRDASPGSSGSNGNVRTIDHRATSMGVGSSPLVLVTGCYAATHGDEAASITGAGDCVVPQDSGDGSIMVDRIARRVDQWLARHPVCPSVRPVQPYSSRTPIHPLPVVPPTAEAGRHVRAELRIQDGCDAHCTFCIIPRIRRTLRSKRIADAVDEARRLVDLGHLEIVLTGIFIGAYGHETALRRNQSDRHADPLADLVDAAAQVPGLERLRISSMEPGDVSEALLDAMIANDRVVVPHLHLPLQSGSDRILRQMNRQYTIGAYLEMIDRVHSALTRDGLPPAITTDIICGFPGETEADFEQTIETAGRAGFLHMHVFPFSPKAGTAAARWTSRFVDERTKKARVRRLIDLENDPDDGLSIRYRRRLLGQTVRVILEQPDRDDPSLMTGRCDHYALIHVPTERPRGSVMAVEVESVSADRTLARPAATTVSLPVV